jgi:hypothetical protein
MWKNARVEEKVSHFLLQHQQQQHPHHHHRNIYTPKKSSTFEFILEMKILLYGEA